MKNNVFIYILITTTIIIFVSIGVVFAFNQGADDDKEELKSKVEEEIDFLENKIIVMMNKLNNINFSNSVLIQEKTAQNSENQESEDNSKTSSETSSNNSPSSSTNKKEEGASNSESNNDSTTNENIKYEVKTGGILVNGLNNQIDWEYMKSNIEMIYTFLPTIIVDLNALEIDSQEILNFSSTLDIAALNIKNEDKVAAASNLASLYSFLPIYRSEISEDQQSINIDYCKKSILNSYVAVEQNNWDEVKNQLSNAVNNYTNVIDSISENIQNQGRISKAYILLNELNNSISIQDKELYYIKYRNVMEELMNL